MNTALKVFAILMVLLVASAKSQKTFKTRASLHWLGNEMLLKVDTASPLPPKLMRIMPRPAKWFATDNCNLREVSLNDTDLESVTNLRFGFTEMRNKQYQQIDANSNFVYALTNFNRKTIYFFEIPTTFTMNADDNVETPVYCWVYTYNTNNTMPSLKDTPTKEEILNCLDQFKLSSYASKEVGLDSNGRPLQNAEVYLSMSKYLQYLSSLQETHTRRHHFHRTTTPSYYHIADIESTIRTTTPNYYRNDNVDVTTEKPPKVLVFAGENQTADDRNDTDKQLLLKTANVLLNFTKKATLFGVPSPDISSDGIGLEDDTLVDIDRLLNILHETTKNTESISIWHYIIIVVLLLLGLAASLARYMNYRQQRKFRRNNVELSVMPPKKPDPIKLQNGKFFYDSVIYEDMSNTHRGIQPKSSSNFKKDYHKMQMSVMPSLREDGGDTLRIKIKPLPSTMQPLTQNDQQHIYDIPRPHNINA